MLHYVTARGTSRINSIWASTASGLQHPCCSYPGSSLQGVRKCFPVAARRSSSTISSSWFLLFLFLPYFVSQHPVILCALSVMLLADGSLQRLGAEKGKFSFALDICISKFNWLKLKKKKFFLNVYDKNFCCMLTIKFKHVLLCNAIEVLIIINAVQN